MDTALFSPTVSGSPFPLGLGARQSGDLGLVLIRVPQSPLDPHLPRPPLSISALGLTGKDELSLQVRKS